MWAAGGDADHWGFVRGWVGEVGADPGWDVCFAVRLIRLVDDVGFAEVAGYVRVGFVAGVGGCEAVDVGVLERDLVGVDPQRHVAQADQVAAAWEYGGGEDLWVVATVVIRVLPP